MEKQELKINVPIPDGMVLKSVRSEIKDGVLILVDDNSGNLYTELAWLNEYREWVDVPHYHKVIGWCEVPKKNKFNMT
ncbi:hypothetical protein [Bacteroides heparinolyticus]|uniref:hypothetical protein n=1 Tax=Prevotella heparinolytica TaxID=28113 RepID=UPI0023F531E3|nr:hypothetical protein [Bacteroides heparinolyticus]